MKTLLKVAALSATMLAAAPSFAADYLPVGPQANVALSTVTDGGWSVCYTGTYGSSVSIASALSGCSGDNLMLAARATGSSTLLVLAQAPRLDVMFDTGASNVTHVANGTAWYYNSSYSWGFAPAGETVSRNSCDTNNSQAALRLCWHTGGGNLNGGWRAGAVTGLNGSTDYERMILSFTPGAGAVPEPASWAMMIGGLGVVGASMRRKARTAVRFA